MYIYINKCNSISAITTFMKIKTTTKKHKSRVCTINNKPILCCCHKKWSNYSTRRLEQDTFIFFSFIKKTWIKKFIYFILYFGIVSNVQAISILSLRSVWCECDTAWRAYMCKNFGFLFSLKNFLFNSIYGECRTIYYIYIIKKIPIAG